MGKKMGKKKGKKGKKKKKAKKAKQECPPIPIPPFQLAPLDICPRQYCPQFNEDYPIEPQPNHYPGIFRDPAVMAVAGSEDGSYESLCKLVRAGLRCTDRVYIMTPWSNYCLVRAKGKEGLLYFLFDGCTCDVNLFRYMDLSCGTAGFVHFTAIDDVVKYLIHSRTVKAQIQSLHQIRVSDIIDEYGSCQYKASNKCMRFR